MKTTSDRYSTAHEGSALCDLLRGAVLFIWCVARVPIGIILAVLEPFVRLVLIGIAFASVITAFVFKGSSVTPAIPFWVMICISFGCVVLLALYHGLLRLLSR
jgi:peptidoglycan/LPS O-acetylase OafA/YrhL